ncbi:hypothetical protein CKQ90_36440, partial [Klebsiella pneumoniae]
RIPYYRPLEPLRPGFLPGRAEQHLAGQILCRADALRIPYYRPLEPLRPGFLPGRAEQHLAGQILCRAD